LADRRRAIRPGSPTGLLRALMTIRGDFLGALHRDESLFDVRRHIDVEARTDVGPGPI
jgi:hypothetical protein